MRKHDVFYFAFGEDMSTQVFRASKGCHSAEVKGTGYIVNRKLVFIGLSVTGHAVATITESYGDIVYGVLYELADYTECDKLDSAFAQIRSHREDIRVRVLPDRRIFDAVMYVSDTQTPEGVIPSPGYMQLLVKAACEHKFPEEYIQYLQSFEL